MAQKIDSLKILRIISCLGVVTVHFGARISLSGHLRTVTDFGAYGVYMFFIISGFLGFYSYRYSSSCIQYYLKRFSRIVPLYYTIIVYNIVLYEIILRNNFVVPVDSTHLGWLRYFFFLNKIIPSKEGFWSNLSATWTIGYFVLFYLLVPVFYKIINTYNKAILFVLFCLVLNYFWRTEWFAPITGLYYFGLGIAIFFSINESKENHLIAWACFTGIFFLLFNFNRIYIFSNIFSLLIIAVKDFKVNNSFVNKCVNLLDEYSYTIYLVHAIIIEAIALINEKQPLSSLQVFMILVAGTVIISLFIQKLIEEPVNKLVRAKI